jgi:hypothetical protein
MYLQSIKSVKHNAAMSVNRSILKKSRHIGFGVFIVHSSMDMTVQGQKRKDITRRTGQEGLDSKEPERKEKTGITG